MTVMGPEHLARLVDEHAAALVLYARQRCANPEDVVQEAFLRLVEQRQAPDSPAAWLFRVVRNLAVSASPVALQLTNVAADAIHATDVALPRDGFTLSGLSFGSLSGSGLGVPAATIGQATVQHVHGDPAKIPAFSLGGLTLPSAQIPSIDSTIPLTIPFDLEGPAAGFDAGILRVTLSINPSLTTRIENLQIAGASASASVGQIVLHDVTLPYDALNLTLSQIGVDTIDIPNFTVG